MCDTCAERAKVMETAFFTTYWESRDFMEALSKATEAAHLFETTQNPPEPDDSAEQQEIMDIMSEHGMEAGIKVYADRHVGRLDGDHAQLLEIGYSMLGDAHQTYLKHDKDKIKTVLELGNKIVASAVMAPDSKDGNPGFLFFLITFAAMLTEVSACPEAHLALTSTRSTIPNVNLEG